MIITRKGQRALGSGDCEFLPLENRAALAVARTCDDESILALHNLSALPQIVELDLSRWQGARVRSLLSCHLLPDTLDRLQTFTLEPYEYLWLKLARSA